jgi:hypothetical protein
MQRFLDTVSKLEEEFDTLSEPDTSSDEEQKSFVRILPPRSKRGNR